MQFAQPQNSESKGAQSMSELVKVVRGEIVGREQRAKGRQAVAEAQLAALRIEGATRLAGHAMDRMIELDDHRRKIVDDDPVRQMLIAEIMATALSQVQREQRKLYDEWQL